MDPQPARRQAEHPLIETSSSLRPGATGGREGELQDDVAMRHGGGSSLVEQAAGESRHAVGGGTPARIRAGHPGAGLPAGHSADAPTRQRGERDRRQLVPVGTEGVVAGSAPARG